MYNINMYEYKDKPFTKVKKFHIHPLNQIGFDKYIGSESHNSNYVSRVNPKVFKEIVGMDYDSIINHHQSLISESKAQFASESNARCHLKEALLKDDCDKDEGRKGMPSINNEAIQKESDMLNGKKLKLTPSHSLKEYNPNFCLSPRSKITERPDLYRTFHRKQSYRDKYGYDRKELTKTNEDRYSLELNQLKYHKLKNEEFNSTHRSEYYPTKRYKGFTSYCVPRTEEIAPQQVHSSLLNRLKSRLERSVSCDNLGKCHEFEVLKKENDDMKENLGYQTNRNFLLSTKLPNVLKIADTKKLIQKIGLGNCKDMGERYNPFSNMPDTINRTKRNYTGSLFLH